MAYFNNTNTPSRGLNNPKSNHNNVAEYLVSAIPWVTASQGDELTQLTETHPIKITFPRVTSFIRVYNPERGSGGDGDIIFGFTNNGVRAAFPSASLNRVYLKNGTDSGELPVKCDKLFIARTGSANGNFVVVAGLTSVPVSQFYDLTGSEGVVFEGVG